MTKRFRVYTQKLLDSPKMLWSRYKKYWKKNWWHKLIVCIAILFLALLGTSYGIARWYIASQDGKPLNLGVSFIPDYAESLGLNPEQTMDALINDLHIKNFRLVSYWSDIEPTQGTYDFSQLDWEFQQADAAGAKVSLSLGLRQPRWPECHIPTWAANEPDSVWEPQLNQFITAVVNRYKNNPALQSYQLENEYFLHSFGSCTNFSRSRLVSEFNLVRKLDPNHTLILTRSNTALGWPVGQPQPDVIGDSVYKRVWSTFFDRYFEYPIPAWYYAFVAGVQEIFTGKNMEIDELQAEAWPPNGKTIPEVSLAEQNKSMNASILSSRINYGEATGMKTIDLWGAEYWYYRLVKEHDPSVWNVAKQAFAQANSKD